MVDCSRLMVTDERRRVDQKHHKTTLPPDKNAHRVQKYPNALLSSVQLPCIEDSEMIHLFVPAAALSLRISISKTQFSVHNKLPFLSTLVQYGF